MCVFKELLCCPLHKLHHVIVPAPVFRVPISLHPHQYLFFVCLFVVLNNSHPNAGKV